MLIYDLTPDASGYYLRFAKSREHGAGSTEQGAKSQQHKISPLVRGTRERRGGPNASHDLKVWTFLRAGVVMKAIYKQPARPGTGQIIIAPG